MTALLLVGETDVFVVQRTVKMEEKQHYQVTL